MVFLRINRLVPLIPHHYAWGMRYTGWLLLFLFGLVSPVEAEIYKWMDADGVVQYSDEPRPGAKPITLPEVSSYQFRIPEPIEPLKGKKQAGKNPAASPSPNPGSPTERQFRILSPTNNQVIPSNSGQTLVQFDVTPPLGQKELIRLQLDGETVADKVVTSIVLLPNLSTGSHVLEARILDPTGKTIQRAKTVLIHVQ